MAMPFLILISFVPLLALLYFSVASFPFKWCCPPKATSGLTTPLSVLVKEGLTLPFIGHALSLGRQGSMFLSSCHRKYGDAFRLTMFGQNMVFLSAPESTVYFFRAPSTCLSFTPAVQQFTHRVFGLEPKDLLPRHRSLLSSLRHTTSGVNLHRHAEILACSIQREAHRVFGGSDQDPTVKIAELYSAVQETFFPAAVSCLFGTKFLERHGQRKLQDMFLKFEGSFERAASPLPQVIQRDFCKSRAFLLEVFRVSIAHGDFNGSVVGKLLLDSGIPGPAGPNLLLTLLWASQANTLPAAFWSVAFLMLPQNMRYVKAIQESVASSSSGNNGELLHRIILHACDPKSLLVRCCHEAIRLRSPSIDIRIAASNIVVPLSSDRRIGIGKGSVVAVSPWISNLDSRFYKAPHTYDPDRESIHLPHPVAGIQGIPGLSFGGGVYRCPGRSFAAMELAVLVGILIAKFDFRIATEGDVDVGKSTRADRSCFPGDPQSLLPPPDLRRLVGIKVPVGPCVVECTSRTRGAD